MRFDKIVWVAAWLALTSNSAFCGCLQPPVTSEAINQFKLHPESLIATSNNDTAVVEATTRSLAGTDPKLAPDLVHVAEGAQPRFRASIAAGLAQAALACLNVDQQGALEIQQAVAAFGDAGTAELIYLVGLYCMVSVTLNGFDVPIPDEATT